MRNKLFLLVAASLVSASVYANEGNFTSVDVNGDGKVTKEEFRGTNSDAGVYSKFDADGNGYLTDDEFAKTNFDEGLFDDWNVNGDDGVDENEFYDGAFTYYDENEDGHWTSGEWDDAGEDGFWDF